MEKEETHDNPKFSCLFFTKQIFLYTNFHYLKKISRICDVNPFCLACFWRPTSHYLTNLKSLSCESFLFLAVILLGFNHHNFLLVMQLDFHGFCA